MSQLAAGHGLRNEVKLWSMDERTAASARIGGRSWNNGGLGSAHLIKFSCSYFHIRSRTGRGIKDKCISTSRAKGASTYIDLDMGRQLPSERGNKIFTVASFGQNRSDEDLTKDRGRLALCSTITLP